MKVSKCNLDGIPLIEPTAYTDDRGFFWKVSSRGDTVHLQPAYKGRIRTAKSMRVTESLSREVLSLPIYPELEAKQLDEVVHAIKHLVLKDAKRG